jgi:hypothetical protein
VPFLIKGAVVKSNSRVLTDDRSRYAALPLICSDPVKTRPYSAFWIIGAISSEMGYPPAEPTRSKSVMQLVFEERLAALRFFYSQC